MNKTLDIAIMMMEAALILAFFIAMFYLTSIVCLAIHPVEACFN